MREDFHEPIRETKLCDFSSRELPEMPSSSLRNRSMEESEMTRYSVSVKIKLNERDKERGIREKRTRENERRRERLYKKKRGKERRRDTERQIEEREGRKASQKETELQ